jgi:hypothetical protein
VEKPIHRCLAASLRVRSGAEECSTGIKQNNSSIEEARGRIGSCVGGDDVQRRALRDGDRAGIVDISELACISRAAEQEDASGIVVQRAGLHGITTCALYARPERPGVRDACTGQAAQRVDFDYAAVGVGNAARNTR